ncbi:uncharacterized protein LOC117807770 isoform X1 [Notolabrus celidotus]|uniref:uncharacterized protein LOC117807770 isoform X1 n=1 Tax=Notolabrus celidotus TaxID=1203425 RepID=UPI00148FC3AF|nr:uncharacterized protein LOC117807770 isoform X1 [Notolabrus celidotus]
MAIATLCAVVAALRVLPNRSQFFPYEHVSLSCGQQTNLCGWMIKRNTCTTPNNNCSQTWHGNNGSFEAIYGFDSGVYWCESAAGERSEAVNINVTDGSVILESPNLPVKEGDNGTLGCTCKMEPSSDLMNDFVLSFPPNHTADFYKDGVLIGSSSTGNMTIHGVSKSDEGLYECNISGFGQSPNSWLTVREVGHPEVPDFPPANTQLPAVIVRLVVVVLISVTLLCLWKNCKDLCLKQLFLQI